MTRAVVRSACPLALLLLLLAVPVLAQETRLVNGFESDAELADWDFSSGTPRLVTEGVTEGQHALEITFDPAGEYDPAHMYWNRPVRDWSAYDALVLDVLNPNDFPLQCGVLIGDQAWADRGTTYWNRHNGGTMLAPGKGQWIIPVRGLYRGEPGSRNADIKSDIDPASIVRLDFGFGAKGQSGRAIIDNIRFVTVARPPGVWAFDVGPPSQATMLGWTAVSHETTYSAERGYGWGPQGGAPWEGADRDTTFGPMLTRDFCEAGGYRFSVAVPPGEYEVLAIFENCGYWGGEQARSSTRTVSVGDTVVWSETRPDGPATALYRFEDVEPVGVDLWDTYMAAEIVKPARFRAEAGDDGLSLSFASDAGFGCRLSALAIHRSDDQTAAAWLQGQMDLVRDEFRAAAVCLDPPAQPVSASAAWAAKGLVAWAARIEDDIVPGSAPAAAVEPEALRLTADALLGESEPLCLALRPLRDLGKCRAFVEADDDFPRTRLEVVRYNTSRGFGTIAYSIRPHTLRPIQGRELDLPAGLARELVVTVTTDANTRPGLHRARLVLEDAAGATVLTVPIEVTVHDVALDRETDFLMGFFGLEPPDLIASTVAREQALEETLALLRDHGMNALSGGPSFRLTGWADGQPQVDFGACDSFFALCRRYGFDRPINGYGGLRFEGLHDGYQMGENAARVAQESGLDYATALGRAWEAVDRHARANDWPTIYYAMCDETRVRDTAERELQFMRLMAEVSARFPRTVRTSGSYSVDFTSRPTDEDDMRTWHQRFFGALDISSLNLHDETVMAEARALGKEVHIYNQGTSRYSFGLYQWSEFTKGVRARWQWHLNVLHGCQFFDLDGREPDTAMLCYGREAIYPTIDFERCREGADDFALLQTLAHAIEANRGAARRPAETDRAAAYLERLTAGIEIDQRDAPAAYDPYAHKLEIARLLDELR